MEHTQTTTDGRFPVSKLIFGLILIAVGVLAFVDAIDLWHPRMLWRLWPLGVIVLGLASEAEALMARRDSSGSLLIGFGVWMLAGMHELFGLSYRTAFPLGIAVVGLFMVLHALIDRPEVKKENNNESR
jgi:Domain of unknown function (DUF5668)